MKRGRIREEVEREKKKKRAVRNEKGRASIQSWNSASNGLRHRKTKRKNNQNLNTDYQRNQQEKKELKHTVTPTT